ncbi:MAG: enoyl-CoA hydratase/isomerase family protein [Ilumatobacteraceae bacterium]
MSGAGRPDLAVALGGDHVATVEIRRGPNNFFDLGLIGHLADVLDDLADGDCRAVVLCSEGKHFCAGANFGGPRESDPGGRHLYDEAVRLFEQPLPIVAAVQGAAIGGGLGLAMAADFRVAVPEARFAANFAALGFHHGFALTVTLPAAVGSQRALDLLYTGRRIGGEEAVRIGLCDRLVALDEVRSAAHAYAAEIAASAPLAIRSIRQTMRGPLAAEVRSALQHEKSEQARLMATADFREGVAAVSQRRRAEFTGR